MRKKYTSQPHSNTLKKEVPPIQLSPSKAVVDRILAFSSSYWTANGLDGVNVELILN
ncbi:hypothetical protein [Paludibacter jiangxiensis]|uniref:Uncharacterized protein n=1 Tax=Paludibacter jiangxiensis TaxID=681398 RepID=A0A171A4C1_9BACT|nr:hypothetical protein [Paludibacter jiangxiensis]GAT63272.1 hypothetical protein PJIAN_3589 [Paludibacter jiangxiensis]